MHSISFVFAALRKLDLSNNHIKKLPATIGDLGCLSELILHNNHLESFSVALCLSTLQRTLQLLDLSQNRLQSLPAQFCQFRELVNLKLDDNELVCLPFHMGRLSKLRFLSAAHNQLSLLPSDFRRLSLENLDLFGNPFIQPNPLDHTMKLTFPLTLQEMSSRAVANLRLELHVLRMSLSFRRTMHFYGTLLTSLVIIHLTGYHTDLTSFPPTCVGTWK